MSRTRRREAAAAGGIEVVWPGKYDARGRRVRPRVEAASLQPSEHHGASPPAHDNLLVHGDNLAVLQALLAQHRGAVDLVYMDPPFATGTAFELALPVHVPGAGASTLRTPAFDDRWPSGAAFLDMLAPRLERIHALLAPHGSLYVHVDPTRAHAVKLLLDEIFGADAFQREIVWRIGWVSGFKTRARNWIRNHDTILFYARDPARLRFHKVYVPHPPGYVRRKGTPGRVDGIAIDDVWNAGAADLALSGADALDSIQIKSFSREKTGYATQKNASLLRRILAASSAPGELVLDPFCGAGTTAAVALAMGRRFLAIDRGAAAIQLARARLLREQPQASWSLLQTEPPIELPLQCTRTGGGVVVRTPADAPGPAVALQLEPGRDVTRVRVLSVALGPAVDAAAAQQVAAGADPLLELGVAWDADPAAPYRADTLRLATAEAAIDRELLGPARARGCAIVQLVDLDFRRVQLVVHWQRQARTLTVRGTMRVAAASLHAAAPQPARTLSPRAGSRGASRRA
ncbi:MAG: site-specific DNA-methyltransferase [Nannocystaceae bacterium]|nr:site-specific DNA-methyltransferase [Nannocystaceae bacterium]